MIPDIGFNISIQRHFCGTDVEGRMTDDTNSHNCMTNGKANRTSRYFTFNAAIHVPTPSPNSAVSKTKTGRNRTCAVKSTREHRGCRNDQTRKVDFGDEICAADKAVTARRDRIREESPRNKTSQGKEWIGNTR